MMLDKHNIGKVNELDCTGCGCCVAICPVQAISYSYNNEGFIFPQVDTDICVGCGKCYERCPQVNPIKKNPIGSINVAQLHDEEKIKRSASGGIFWAIAEIVLENKGYVCGCVLDDDMLPVHIITNNRTDVLRMQGSKYVQSRLDISLYIRIQELLNVDKTVLFSGTPCQISALYSFLKKDYKNLLSVGLICHGVAGPGLYLHYIHRIEKQLGGTIKNVQFRSREVGAYPLNHSIRIETDRGVYNHQAFSDPYGSNFYHNRILRESCYRCKYAEMNRIEDITLGDYNEVVYNEIGFPSTQGYNILIINTDKGLSWVEKTKKNIYISKIRQDYRQVNLVQPTLRPKSRNKLKKAQVSMQTPYTLSGYVLRVTFADLIKKIIPSGIKDNIKMAIGRRRK